MGAGWECRAKGLGLFRVTHLQVSVHHSHLVTMQYSLQDLLDTVTGEKGEGSGPLGSWLQARAPSPSLQAPLLGCT